MKNYANYIGLSIVVTAFAIAVLYFEIYLGLQPCPLCIFDRIILGCIAFVFVIAVAKPSKTVACNIINTVLSGIGILVASRHVWLQHSLEQGASCVADFNYLFDVLPFQDFIAFFFNTGISCTEIMWSMLGFSIPELTLVLFIFLYLLSGIVVYNNFKRKVATDKTKNRNKQ
jgi:protein dithiol:quinone oxidoreductase